jgi:hypothetical protein
MSQQELRWLKEVRDGVITQRQAAERMNVGDRWVRESVRRHVQVGGQVGVH